MIDLHCHILPGVDDGAQDMAEAIAMAENAVEEGITHIVATPHHKCYGWENEKEKIIRLVAKVQAEINQKNIPITILPGQEVRIYGEIIEDIEAGKIQFIDEENQYLLIEFPPSEIPTYTEQLFYQLQHKGVIPIIVHPERNRSIQKDPNQLKEMIDKGALVQLTAGSYVGTFGREIERLSRDLIEADLVHLIASDAHNVTNRQFHLKEAYEKLEKEYGSNLLKRYKQMTRDLMIGRPVFPPTARKIKKKRFFGLF